MSLPKIRTAFEEALAAMTPALATAWENGAYSPIAGTPYQEPTLNPGPVKNDENGRAFQQEGFFQVALRWPAGSGTADINARAELLRSTFYKGRTVTSGGVSAQVTAPPSILPGVAGSDGRFVVAVSIPFLANLQN